MDEPSERNRTRYPTAALLVAGGIGVLLLLLSFVIRVRIVVEQPRVGDVTATVELLWRALLGIATLGSLAVGVYDLVAGIELRAKKEKRFEISGDANDIDLHVHVTGIAGSTSTVPGDERDSKATTGTGEPSEEGTSSQSSGFESGDVDPPGDD